MKNLLLVLAILLVSSCASLDPAGRYAKNTKEYTYQFRMNQQSPSFLQNLFSKDPRFKQAKNWVETQNRLAKEAEKEADIKADLESIKSKVQ